MRASGWRKIATSIWGWPGDPQVYGRLEVDAAPLLEAVDVFVIVAAGGGGDLSGVRIREADAKAAAEIATELDERATAARLGKG